MFDECLKTGGYGEHAVWNRLIKSRDVRSIVDVREDKIYQDKDIDFLVENNDRQFTPIEVKTDYKAHETGNLVYEATTSGNIGCFEKTEARLIMYFIPGSEQILVLSVKNLRNYIGKSHLKEVSMGDNATGFLLPIEELRKNNVILNTYEGVK